jgi:hypothetical protein
MGESRPEAFRAMSGTQFELYVAGLLRAMGHNTRVLGGSGDQGVDLIVDYFGERVAVQCKNYAKPVGNRPVQEVFAGAKHHGCQRAWVVAPAGFTSGAFALARSVGVKLFDAGAIRAWVGEVDKVASPQPRSEMVPPPSEQRHGTVQVSYERRRPRMFSDNPWIRWGCEVPVFGCLFVGLAFLLMCIVVFVAYSPVYGGGLVMVCIVLFGGPMALGFVAGLVRKYNS